jgi:hypothetical protein
MCGRFTLRTPASVLVRQFTPLLSFFTTDRNAKGWFCKAGASERSERTNETR